MNEPVSLTDVLVYLAETPAWVILLTKATVLVAAAWLMHHLFARWNPRWRVILWRGLAVGLILLPPFLWIAPGWNVQVQKPLEPRSEMARLQQLANAIVGQTDRHTEPAPQELTSASSRSSRSVPVSSSTTPFNLSEEDPFDERVATGPIAELRQLLDWRIWILPEVRWRWLFAAWVIGTSILMFRLLLGYRLLNRLLAFSTPASQDVVEESLRIARALGIRRSFAVRELQFVTPPFLCGLRNPVLVLPARLCQNDFRRELPAILAHELSHLRSFDLLWNPALHLLSILLWFNPLTWRMRHAHAGACESVADAVSAAYLGDRVAYSRTLARVALEIASPPPVVGMAMARVSDIRRRLEILNRNPVSSPLPVSRVLGFGLLSLVALVFLGGLHFVFAERPRRSEENLNKPVLAVPMKVVPATPHPIFTDRGLVAGASNLPQAEVATGRVQTADGLLLPNVRVYVNSIHNSFTVENGSPKIGPNTLVVETDQHGQFTFHPQSSPYRIIVLHDAGFAAIPEPVFRSAPEITLQSWARVEGKLHIGSQPAAGESVSLDFDGRNTAAGSTDIPAIEYVYETTTNQEGRFVFERVPPGTGRVVRTIPVPPRGDGRTAAAHAVSAVFTAGETSVVTLGGHGRPVIGRVVLPRGNRKAIDWSWGYGQLQLKGSSAPPTAADGVDRDSIRSYGFTLQPDGAFRIEDVPEGTYELMIWVDAPPAAIGEAQRSFVGVARRDVTLAPMSEGRVEEPLDLGLLKLITIRSAAGWSESVRLRIVDLKEWTADGRESTENPDAEEAFLRETTTAPSPRD